MAKKPKKPSPQHIPPPPSSPNETFITKDSPYFKDPARYVVDPGDGLTKPGNLKHIRPRLVSGAKSFRWPLGIEGFRVTGQAQLSLHHYLGGNTVDAQTLHREEGRIELTGTFPGLTSQVNMIMLRDVLRSQPPQKGMILFAQGVFEVEQFVIPESWDFTHEAGDGTHSIDYSVTLVRVGTGKPLPDPAGKPAPQNPGTKTNPHGKGKFFTVRVGVRTFRAIAKVVYGNADQWPRLMQLNQHIQGPPYSDHGGTPISQIPLHKLPIVVWPLGIKIRYRL